MEGTESLRAAVIILSADLLLNKESITYGKTIRNIVINAYNFSIFS